MKTTKVLMLGTKAPGGMDFVVRSYLNSELGTRYGLKFIPTHIETHNLFKVTYFLGSIIRTIPYLFNKECKIFHMHISSGGSIYRKRILMNLAHTFGKKVIFHAHGAGFFTIMSKKNNMEKNGIIKTLNKADCLIVLSNIRKKEYSQIVSPEKISAVYNFSKDPEYKRDYSQNKIPKAITLGRIGERKGTALLIHALDRSRNDKSPSIKLTIYGDGELEKYRLLVKEMNLEDKITLPGWVSGRAKEEALEKSDFFILPSYHEDLPIGIIEAMSYKLPIISTITGGISELVQHGTTGILIKPGDRKALLRAITKLAKNSKLRENMGKRGYARFQKHFEQSVVIKQISELYDRLGDER